MGSLSINKRKVFLITVLFSFWHLFDKYWEFFTGSDWTWEFFTAVDGVKSNPYCAAWFMSDLSEFLMILIVFIALRLLAPMFQIKGFVIWDLYIGYALFSISDFVLFQSQTPIVRELLGVLLIVTHLVFYFKYKEDGV